MPTAIKAEISASEEFTVIIFESPGEGYPTIILTGERGKYAVREISTVDKVNREFMPFGAAPLELALTYAFNIATRNRELAGQPRGSEPILPFSLREHARPK